MAQANQITDAVTETVYQEQLELRYGPAVAQQIMDEIHKVEHLQLDYLDVKGMNDLAYELRQDARSALMSLRHWRKVKNDITAEGNAVPMIRRNKLEEKLFQIEDKICVAENHFHEVRATYRGAHSKADRYFKRYTTALKQN